MAENSAISWTHSTFNPVIGCTKVSAACDFCYAEDHAKKWEPLVTWGKPGQKSILRRTSESNWRKPLAWNKAAKQSRKEHRVFCASLSDVFDNDWESETRRDLWDLIGATPHLTWLLLTKRPQNILKMIPTSWAGRLLDHIWIGTTTEDQAEFDRRWPYLQEVPARTKFISYEPALGPLSFAKMTPKSMPDWVICGGESGPHRRPFDLAWAYEMQNQCRQFSISFFFKQDSSHKPGCRGRANDDLWLSKQLPGVA